MGSSPGDLHTRRWCEGAATLCYYYCIRACIVHLRGNASSHSCQVAGSCGAGHRSRVYAFATSASGGRFGIRRARDGLPTKTPVLLIQSIGKLSSFISVPDHVERTVCLFCRLCFGSRGWVRAISIWSRRLVIWSHLSMIVSPDSHGESWSGSVITRSHRIFQIRWADSATRICSSRDAPGRATSGWCGIASMFEAGIAAVIMSGVCPVLWWRRFFRHFQTVRCPGAVHPVSMCSIVSSQLHTLHVALISFPAICRHHGPTLKALCRSFHRKTCIFRLLCG